MIFNKESKDSLYDFKARDLYKIKNYIQNILHDIINIFPNMIINSNQYDKHYIPRHWRLSNKHNMDIQDILKENYKNLSSFYDNEILKEYLNLINDRLKYNLLFAELTNYLIPYENKTTQHVIDDELFYLLMEFYFLNAITTYINNINDTLRKDEFTSFATSNAVDETLVDFDPETNLLSDTNNNKKQSVALLLNEYFLILNSYKECIDLNYNQMMDKILRSKEREKEGFTKFLKDLTDEERDIENVKKNLKLGDWSLGLQKGLTQYVKETYDQERELIDKNVDDYSTVYKTTQQDDLDTSFSKNYLIQEEQEINDLSHLGDDDDRGEEDDYN